jgi:hypothetical protein
MFRRGSVAALSECVESFLWRVDDGLALEVTSSIQMWTAHHFSIDRSFRINLKYASAFLEI